MLWPVRSRLQSLVDCLPRDASPAHKFRRLQQFAFLCKFGAGCHRFGKHFCLDGGRASTPSGPGTRRRSSRLRGSATAATGRHLFAWGSRTCGVSDGRQSSVPSPFHRTTPLRHSARQVRRWASNDPSKRAPFVRARKRLRSRVPAEAAGPIARSVDENLSELHRDGREPRGARKRRSLESPHPLHFPPPVFRAICVQLH